MTAYEKEQHRQHRAAMADAIAAEPRKFKVCSQCLSIAYKHVPVCPFCHAYRFMENSEGVWLVTVLMKRTAFPLTLGIAPRITPIEAK